LFASTFEKRNASFHDRPSYERGLLYSWLIPYIDDAGRISANPRIIKAMVVPLLGEIMQDDSKQLLYRMRSYRLMGLYVADETCTDYEFLFPALLSAKLPAQATL